MKSKDDLKEIKCPTCNKVFYVEPGESPEYCPFCHVYTNSKPEFLTTHRCSITGATFTLKEASEATPCGIIGGKKQACVDCENVTEK